MSIKLYDKIEETYACSFEDMAAYEIYLKGVEAYEDSSRWFRYAQEADAKEKHDMYMRWMDEYDARANMVVEILRDVYGMEIDKVMLDNLLYEVKIR